jgi:IS6 family transposase
LNNIIELRSDKLKHLINPTLGFKAMKTASATIKGFEVMRMFKKGRFDIWKYGQGIQG